MRASALCAAVLLGGCTIPLTQDVAVHLSGAARVGDRANAARPSAAVSLRLSLVRRP